MATKKRKPISVTVLVALIGLGGTLITAIFGYLGIKYQTEKPIIATQTAQASNISTNTEGTVQSTTTLNETPLFTVDVLSQVPLVEENAVITIPVDGTSGQATINDNEVDKNKWVLSVIPEYPSYFEILLTGKDELPIYISNRIPIKIISYEPVQTESNILTLGHGGGNYVWVFSTEIRSNSVLSQDSIVWASYPIDMIQRFQKLKKDNEVIGNTENIPIEILSFPTSIQNIYLDNSATFPDFFTLSKNELLVMGIGAYFIDPGIYTIQPGVEFVVNGKKEIRWSEKIIDIYVPNNFTLWLKNYQDDTKVGITKIAKCEYDKENGHACQN